MNIDGTDLILGRVATVAAKKALLGENVIIVNCDKIIISGQKAGIFQRHLALRTMGNKYNGPFIPRLTDRFVRRSIRRMLPHKQPRGADAFKRIMCHSGIPSELKDQEFHSIEDAHRKRLNSIQFVTIKEICKVLGKE